MSNPADHIEGSPDCEDYRLYDDKLPRTDRVRHAIGRPLTFGQAFLLEVIDAHQRRVL